MTTAELTIVNTSSTIARYRLVDSAGRVLWQNRVEPTEAGHAGARGRMAAWALKHNVVVREAQPEPAAAQQVIIPGRYGRH